MPDWLFSDAPHGALVLDESLALRYANPAARPFLAHGLSPELGTPVTVVLGVTDEVTFLERLHAVRRTRVSAEFTVTVADGARDVNVTAYVANEAVIVLLRAAPVSHGRAAAGVDRGVDDGAESDAAPSVSAHNRRADYLDRVLAATNAAAFDLDLQTGVSYLNAQYGTLFGYSAELAPTRWEEYLTHFDADDMLRLQSAARVAAAAGTSYREDARIIRVDGSRGWVRVVADVQTNADGVGIRSSGTLIDVTTERLAVESLRESERQLHAAQRLAGIGSWTWHIPSGAVTWSDEMFRILGYDRETVTPSFDLVLAVAVDDARRSEFLTRVHRALDAREAFEFEMPMRRIDGAIRILSTRGEVERTAAGEPIGMTGTAEDVTERRHAMESLRQAEQELYRAQRMARVGSFVHATHTGQLWWSPMTATILEIGEKETPSLALAASRFSRRDVRRYRVLLQRAIVTGEAFAMEAETTMPSGQRLVLRLSGEADRNSANETMSLHGLLADVTAQREQERALRESEQRFRTLWEASPVGIRFTNASGTSMYANARMLEMFDCSFEEFRNEQWRNRIHHDDRARVAIEARAALDNPQHARIDYRIVRRDGSLRFVRATLAILRESDGSFAGHIGALEDLTDEMLAREEAARLEQQMHQSQKLESLGVLAGGIAHDFNNLLVGVLTNASVALMDMSPGEPAYDTVREIERAAQRAAELTRQLLAYAGKGRFIIEPLSFTELAVEMTQLLRTVVSKRASLRLDVQHDLPLVRGDATQLRQVLMNLITNASDSLGDGDGEILLRTYFATTPPDTKGLAMFGGPLLDRPYVVLDVTDTGTGMREEMVQRIFDPFFTTKFTGRGLGLAATLGIVRGHDGVIVVQTALGRGTSVSLHFPVTGDVRREVTVGVSVPVVGAGTVLVVDDDDGVRAVARALLQRQGYSVLVAHNGKEAVERFAELASEIRVVLLDLTMPVMGGEDALRLMRAIDPTVRVVLMSGYSDMDVEDTFLGAGLSGFLQKPFRAEDVYRAIDVALADLGSRT